MAEPRAQGSLVLSASHGSVFGSGLIGGKVALQDAPAEDAITLSIGLRLGRGSRPWLSTVGGVDVAVHLPGAELDAIYAAGSLYVAATFTEERLEGETECNGLPLEKRRTSSGRGPGSGNGGYRSADCASPRTRV